MGNLKDISQKYLDPSFHVDKQVEVEKQPTKLQQISQKYLEGGSKAQEVYEQNRQNIQDNWQKGIDAYNLLPNNPDFATTSLPIESINNDRYKLINGGVVYGDPISEFDNAPSETRFEDDQEINQMNETERRIYTHLYNQEGQLKADEYIRQLQPILNKRRQDKFYNAETQEGKVADMSNGQLVGGNIASVGALPMSAVSSVDIASQKGRQIVDSIMGRTQVPIDYNTPAQAGTNYRNAIREETSSRIENPITNFLYQTGMSIADSTVGVLLASAGIPNPGLLLGMDAGIQSAKEAKARGLSDNEALLTGLFAGIAEEFFEEYSIDKLLTDGLPIGGKAKFINMLKQMGVEGSEEVFTSIANRITDGLINADRSQIQQDIQRLVAQGYTLDEATKAVEINFAKQLALDFLGGAVSGGVFGLGANIKSDINAIGKGSKYIADNAKRNQLINESTALGGKSQEYASKIKDDNSLKSRRQLGYLESLNQYETTNKAVEKAQNDYGMKADTMTLRSLQKQANGENLTPFDEARIKKYNEQYQDLAKRINKNDVKNVKNFVASNTETNQAQKKETIKQTKAFVESRKASDIVYYKAGMNESKVKDDAEKLGKIIRNTKFANELVSRNQKIVYDVERFKGHEINIGFYDTNTNEIVLNPLSSFSDQMRFVTAHEIIHDAKAKGKQSYDDLVKMYLENEVKYEGTPTFKNGKLVNDGSESYKELRKLLDLKKKESELYKNDSDEVLLEERVAKYIEDMAGDTDNAELIFKDQTKAKSFLERINGVINKFAGVTDNTNEQWKKLASIINKGLDAKTETKERFVVKDGLMVDSETGEKVENPTDFNDSASMQSTTTLAEGIGLDVKIVGGVLKYYNRLGNQVTKVSKKNIENSAIGNLIRLSIQEGTITEAQAKKQVESITDLMNMVLEVQEPDLIWAYAGAEMFSALKSNADSQYTRTIDFTTICRKTENMITAISNAMVEKAKKNGKGGLIKEEIIELQNDLINEGSQVPCPVCYVFSRWAGVGSILDGIYELQEMYKGASKEEVRATMQNLENEILKEQNSSQKKKSKAINDLLKKKQEELDKLNAERQSIENTKGIGYETALESVDRKIANVEKEIRPLLKYSFAKIFLKDSYKPVPSEILYDLNRAEDFARDYPDVWKFRTTRGSGAGKAILPYSDMRFGDIILGYSGKVEDIPKRRENFGELGEVLTDSQRKAFNTATKNVKAQNLLGGERFQSTSDFRYEYALDYFMAFLELQAIGSNMQTYTKIIEFADLVGAVGGDGNLSLMPLNAGYKDGHLIFSSVTGMNFEVAKKARAKYDSIQTILVGINEKHIRLALKDSEETLGLYVDFVIPYHASGASIDKFVTQLLANLNEQRNKENYQDFAPFQEDLKNAYATEEQLALRDARKIILTGRKDGRKAYVSQELLNSLPKKSKDITNMSFDELYDIELKALGGDKEAIKEYKSWSSGVLYNLYQKMNSDEYKGVYLTSGQAGKIMPHEYWDKSTTRKNAYVNGFIFRSYCYSLGLTPRFSTRSSKVNADFTNEDGYWKLLIDRPMYNNDGTYREQNKINITNLKKEMLTEDYGEKEWGGVDSYGNKYRVDRPDKSKAIKASEEFLGRHYSDTEIDSEGNELSKGQQEYFKDSKARNKNGNLSRMFHGTWDFGFTIFDSNYSDDKTALFFTDNLDTAKTYSLSKDEARAVSKDNNYIQNAKNSSIEAMAEEVTRTHLDGIKKARVVYDDDKAYVYVDYYNERKSFPSHGKYEAYNESYFRQFHNPFKRGVYSVYLNLVNPLVIDAKGNYWNKLNKIEDSKYEGLSTTRDFVKYAKDNGYDGVIFNNIIDNSSASKSPSNVMVAFDSNQVKSTDNKNPTSNPDIRYSNTQLDAEYMDAVNKGDTKTAQKLVDRVAKENGYTIKAYHGTRNIFTIFDKTKSNKYNYFGENGFYFSNKESEANNYASKNGEFTDDVKAKIEDEVLYRFEELGYSYEDLESNEHIKEYNEIYDKVVEEFSNNSRTINVFLKIENPAYYNGKGFTDANGNKIDGIVNGEEAQSLEALGYDGIIDNSRGGYNSVVGRTHYVVFNPSQIKSADAITYDDNGNVIPLSERFNDSNNDIRWSDSTFNANSGYDGYSMSNRAREAYENGEMPLSKWTKEEILNKVMELNPSLLDDIKGFNAETLKKNLLKWSSWHHTSKYYNPTAFYSINENYLENLTKDEIKDWEIVKSAKPNIDSKDITSRADEIYTKLQVIFSSPNNNYKTFNGLFRAYRDGKIDIDKLYAQSMEDIISNIKENDSSRIAQWEKLPDGHWRKEYIDMFNNNIEKYIAKEHGIKFIEYADDIPRREKEYQQIKSLLQNEDIRWSDTGIGYHAGDLGKAESLGNQGVYRNSGHFGSGTYFVGNEENINHLGYGKRPHHTINLSKYNLYKPYSLEDAYKLSDGLRQFEDVVNPKWTELIINDEFFPFFENTTKNFDKYGIEYLPIDEWLKEEHPKWEVYPTEQENLENYYDDYQSYLDDVGEDARKEYRDLSDARFKLYLLFGNKVKDALRSVFDYQQETKDVDFEDKYTMDSYATRFMKSLGYEGVDVSNIPQMDNTAWGSVIYDLKGEDLAKKQAIGTARWSDTQLDENDPIYQELLEVYGIMPKGANRTNTVDVPKATPTGNVRRFAQSQMESPFSDKKYETKVKKAIADNLLSYKVEGDASAIDYANKTLADNKFEGALKIFNNAIATDNVDKKTMVLGQRLWIESAQKKDYDTMLDIGSTLAVQGTRAGQMIQSLNLIKKFTPQGQLMTLEKYVDQMNKDREKDPKVKKELEEATQKQQVIQKDIDKLQKKIDDKTKKNQLKEEQINKLNKEIAKLKEEYDKLKKQTSSDTAKIVRRNQKLQTLDSQIKQLTKNLNVVESHLENLDNEVNQMNELKKKLNEVKKTINKHKVTLDDATIQNILNAQTRGELDRAVEQAYVHIAEQVPSTWLDKWNAWRYMSMLTNPTTHIRNIVGNLTFIPAMELKNLITYGLQEKLGNKIGLDEKTTLKVEQKYKDEALKVYEENTNFLMSSGKYNANDIISENRRIFQTQAIETVRKLNGKFLEAEDGWFLKKAFVKAYSRYMQANPNADKQKAFDYAKNEAWKATYRDASVLAEKINAFAKTNAGTEILVGAILPFKKTPINILKRGIEYSPIGLFKSVYDMTYGLKHPEKFKDLTPAKALDKLASKLSGTIIILIGMLLARWGLLNGKGDDESTAYEKQTTGFQPFSMNLGKYTYTLDWMSPTAMPLFVGVEIHNALQNDFEFKGMIEALYNIPAPLFEMSLLSGLGQVIDQTKYAESTSEKAMLMASTALTSYLGQALPTLGRRLASIADANIRNVYYNNKKTNVPKGLQVFGRQAVNKIPFASKSLEPKIDVWGREITSGGSIERHLEALISPGYWGKYQATRVDEAIIKLYQATGDARCIPNTSRANYYKVDGESKYMDANQYTAYSRTEGKTKYKEANSLISSSWYKSLSDKEKVDALSEIYSYSKWYALRNNFRDYTNDEYDKTQALLEKTGMTYAQYYGYYKTYKDLADSREYTVNKDGEKEYKQTASDVLKKYLLSTNLNQYQCQEIYRKIFPNVKKVPSFAK